MLLYRSINQVELMFLVHVHQTFYLVYLLLVHVHVIDIPWLRDDAGHASPVTRHEPLPPPYLVVLLFLTFQLN